MSTYTMRKNVAPMGNTVIGVRPIFRQNERNPDDAIGALSNSPQRPWKTRRMKHPPRVALIKGPAGGMTAEMLRGIARYVREHRPDDASRDLPRSYGAHQAPSDTSRHELPSNRRSHGIFVGGPHGRVLSGTHRYDTGRIPEAIRFASQQVGSALRRSSKTRFCKCSLDVWVYKP